MAIPLAIQFVLIVDWAVKNYVHNLFQFIKIQQAHTSNTLQYIA